MEQRILVNDIIQVEVISLKLSRAAGFAVVEVICAIQFFQLWLQKSYVFSLKIINFLIEEEHA
jgi:hypothetical protein